MIAITREKRVVYGNDPVLLRHWAGCICGVGDTETVSFVSCFLDN